MWTATCHQICLILSHDQEFCAPKLCCNSQSSRMWLDWTAKPGHPCSAAQFFGAANGPVLSLSFSLDVDRGHAHDGGARRRRIAARMAQNIATTDGRRCPRGCCPCKLLRPTGLGICRRGLSGLRPFHDCHSQANYRVLICVEHRRM